MTTNPTAPEVVGPHKRKLSTKATTNADPQVDFRKRKKLGAAVKKSVTAPTKKRTSATITKTASKAAPVPKRASAKAVPAKRVQKQTRTVGIEEVSDDSDSHISIPPRNPKHILEATDGSDDNDDNSDEEEDDNTNLEAPKESPEVEMGTWFNSGFVLN